MRVTMSIAEALGARERRAIRMAGVARTLRAAGAALGLPERASLAVRLTDDAELAALNARFAGVEAATDVLAFPGDGRQHTGDVAISVERALAQAADGTAELRLLAVHALLHCVGHDHADGAGAATMTAATRRLLPDQDVPELIATEDGAPT